MNNVDESELDVDEVVPVSRAHELGRVGPVPVVGEDGADLKRKREEREEREEEREEREEKREEWEEEREEKEEEGGKREEERRDGREDR